MVALSLRLVDLHQLLFLSPIPRHYDRRQGVHIDHLQVSRLLSEFSILSEDLLSFNVRACRLFVIIRSHFIYPHTFIQPQHWASGEILEGY